MKYDSRGNAYPENEEDMLIWTKSDMEKIFPLTSSLPKRIEPNNKSFSLKWPAKSPMPQPERNHPNFSEVVARLKPYLVSTAMDLEDREITYEFVDTSFFGGSIVEGDPNDARVIVAARYVVCQHNQQNRGIPLSLVSILKVNNESLEPQLHGFHHYITLVAKDLLGYCAEYEAKVFSSDIGALYLRRFRLRPCNYDIKDPSSVATTSLSVLVNKENEVPNHTLKEQKQDVQGKLDEEETIWTHELRYY